jgi:hypothetical protein
MVTALALELRNLDYRNINLYSGCIAEFERGKREPIPPVLPAYGRLAKCQRRALIDDKLETSSRK